MYRDGLMVVGMTEVVMMTPPTTIVLPPQYQKSPSYKGSKLSFLPTATRHICTSNPTTSPGTLIETLLFLIHWCYVMIS